MSAAQDYYNQVLGMGHSPENALAYTRQHYPDFVPGVAQAVAPPVMAPVSQQPVPAAQPVAQPAVASAPAQAAPVAAAPAVAAPAAAAPSAYAPMAATPLPAGGTTPMMWGAVACIVFALLLSMAGQFSHSWIVNNEDEGFTMGLNTVRGIDCSFEETDVDVEVCKSFAYTFLSDDYMETAIQANTSDADVIQVGKYTDFCENNYKVHGSNG